MIDLRDNMEARRRRRAAGFSLIELMIVLAVAGILSAIAYPSYSRHVVRSARQAAQAELVDLATLQEKIYLNSGAYTASATTAYNGTSTGGLGITSGRTRDSKYTISATVAAQTFTITATPVAGAAQANDGNLTISANGARTWGSSTW